MGLCIKHTGQAQALSEVQQSSTCLRHTQNITQHRSVITWVCVWQGPLRVPIPTTDGTAEMLQGSAPGQGW